MCGMSAPSMGPWCTCTSTALRRGMCTSSLMRPPPQPLRRRPCTAAGLPGARSRATSRYARARGVGGGRAVVEGAGGRWSSGWRSGAPPDTQLTRVPAPRPPLRPPPPLPYSSPRSTTSALASDGQSPLGGSSGAPAARRHQGGGRGARARERAPSWQYAPPPPPHRCCQGWRRSVGGPGAEASERMAAACTRRLQHEPRCSAGGSLAAGAAGRQAAPPTDVEHSGAHPCCCPCTLRAPRRAAASRVRLFSRTQVPCCKRQTPEAPPARGAGR